MKTVLVLFVIFVVLFKTIVEGQMRTQNCFAGREVHKAGLESSDIDKILRIHNTFRSCIANDGGTGCSSVNTRGLPQAENMQSMNWNAELAASAQQALNNCDPRSYSGFNLVSARQQEKQSDMPIDPTEYITSVLKMYFDDSISNVSFNNCKSKPHETLMIQATTSEVGCGFIFFRQQYDERRYVYQFVCIYGPSSVVDSGNRRVGYLYYPGRPACEKHMMKPNNRYPGLCDIEVSKHYIGCYETSQIPNRCSYEMNWGLDSVTKMCISICKMFFHRYVSFSKEHTNYCHCYDNPVRTKQLADEECQQDCSDDPLCLPNSRITLYATGVKINVRRDGVCNLGFNTPEGSSLCFPNGQIVPENNSPFEVVPVEQVNPPQFEIIEVRPSYPQRPTMIRPTTSPPVIPQRPVNRPKPVTTQCTQSVTTYNNIGNTKLCSGKLIFEDDFNSAQIDKSKWSNVVRVSDSPDFDFAVFWNKETNSFVRDGKLFLKATLGARNQLLGRYEIIPGCTATGTACLIKDQGFNFFHNVLSAQLTTEKSFNFRYGIIEIMAKFPVGDWLFPELYLEPKDRPFGTDFRFGRIIISLARGNENLQTSVKGVEEIGSKSLSYGVLMGYMNKTSPKEERFTVKDKFIKAYRQEGWNKAIHNYTLVWSPDDIQLIIDGIQQPSLMSSISTSRLCPSMNLNRDCNSIYNSESRISPFDQNYYIKFGLSAGGTYMFPDDVTNRGLRKPWDSSDPKREVTFYRNEGTWSKTWSDPQLQIDSVRVYAL